MDGIYLTLIPLLTARVLEILSQPPMRPAAVGGLAEVIRGLLVSFFSFLRSAGNSNDDSDIVACPDKLTWGVRYLLTSTIVVT